MFLFKKTLEEVCDLCFIKPVWEICTSITNYHSFRQVIVKYVGTPNNQVRGGGVGEIFYFSRGYPKTGGYIFSKNPPFLKSITQN